MKTTSNTTILKTIFTSAVFALLVTNSNAQQLIINQRSHLVMNGNVSLVVNNASLKNDGNFYEGTGTVKFSGSNDTASAYLGGNNKTTFYNLTVSKSANGVALKSGGIVRNVLAMEGGTLYTDSNLTMRSDSALTSRVAPVAVNSNIIGKTKVERYIPARRAWRMLTAPLTDAGTIFNTWQNGGVYQPNINTFVTGPGANANNGLDISPLNNTSMKTWNPNTQAYTNVSNTKVAISAGTRGSGDNTAYFMFVRGDRTQSNFSTSTCNATTLSSTGRLQIGTQHFTVASTADAYTMVGNPYASPVDFSTLSKTNLVNRFYVWDPTLNILGGYVMLDDLSNSGTYTKSVAASNQTKDIQSGQAFFVMTKTNGAASVTFNESNKSTFTTNTLFRPTGNGSQFLRVNLNLENSDSTILADGIFAEFNDNYSSNVNQDDAVKFANINENVCFVRDGNALAAERRPFVSGLDTLYLKMTKTTARNYSFEIVPTDFYGTDIFVEDAYLNTSTMVSSFTASKFAFTIDGNAASASANRFRIVFKKYNVLPVTLSAISATAQSNNIAVEWTVENEMNMVKYVVEKSTDGSNYSTGTTITVEGNNDVHNTYNWLDVTAAQGVNFYRIKMFDKSGEVKYSSIVKVLMSKTTQSSMTIYPNPVRNNVINLQLSNQVKGTYQLKLSNNGQAVYSSSMINNSSNSTLQMNVPVKMAAGVYQLEVVSPDNSRTTKQVVVE